MSKPSATELTGPPRRRRWPAVLAVTVGLVAAVALVAAIFAPDRGGVDPQPVPTTTAATDPTTSAAIANGCLGGAADLDQAVLTAQQEAPLTDVGAAEFAATYSRWLSAQPAPSEQAATAAQVWAEDATDEARDLSSELDDEPGYVYRANFLEGVYYVEEFSDGRAVVTVLATITGTKDGQPLPAAEAPVQFTLIAESGAWHVQDVGGTRTVEDIKAIGAPLAGGC